jgi:hypothetical protein
LPCRNPVDSASAFAPCAHTVNAALVAKFNGLPGLTLPGAIGLLAPRGQVSLNGSIGSEKAGLLDDSAVAGLLAKRFG